MSKPSSDTPAFLRGGGEMGALMRAHDWAATPFGPVEGWPQSLRSMVGGCLNSPLLGTILWGSELRMLYNDAYIESMADRHPGALGRPVKEVWGETWEIVAPRFHQVMRTGEGFAQDRVELPMVRNGQPELTYWNISATPIYGEDGSIAGLLNQGIEITGQVLSERQRTAAKQQLRETNRNLAHEVAIRTEERDLMWHTSVDLMVVIDFNGVFHRVNPAWTALLGFEPEELVGHHVNEFVIADDHHETVDAYESTAKGHPVRLINRYRHKNGSLRWISWVAAPAGNMTYATGRDITEDIARQAQLESTHEQLRQAQKMEAVGQLTGGLAHDFNNLLAGISVSLEMIDHRISQGRPGDISKYLTVAHGATKRAAALTHRLLAFSRRQTLAPKPTDAAALVEDMLDMIRRTVGPNITVVSLPAPGLWPALVDPSQLENALLNLCLNARDALVDGGCIVIEMSNRIIDADGARQHDLPEGQYLAMHVTDNGTGMSPEVLNKVFDPFFTTKPIGKGTGLGLSMIYGFTQQSGGQVRIASALGAGTTVSLYLPRYLGPLEVSAGAAAQVTASAVSGSGTVLLVEDEPAIRILVVDLLHDLGYRTIEAEDSAAGLEVLKSPAGIDLLISDVGLPGGMNGMQLANAGRISRPELRVLFITGYAADALPISLAPGMSVLTKPFAVADLAGRIRELIG